MRGLRFSAICLRWNRTYLLAAVFFAGTVSAAAAFFAAQRFFNAATIAALPAALSFRLGLEAFGVLASGCPLEAAHRFRCAAAIALRPAALIFRRAGVAAVAAALVPAGVPESIARRSAIWASILTFCSSKPRMAAEIISFVSFGVGM